MNWPQRGDRPVSTTQRNHVMLRVWTAYRCMLLGTAGRDEWSDLADALNMVESLCEKAKLDAAKFMPHVVTAQGGMVHAMRCLPGPMQMSVDELQSLAEVCTQYDQALARLSAGTMESAKLAVLHRVSQARASEASEVVTA